MKGAELPPNEAERLRALARYAILDSPAEGAFDEIASTAADICAAPTALITLIDERRQWFKSRVSFAATETSRDLAFCAYTLLQRDVMVVPDATRDARFSDNELVTGPPSIRFYAGAPLVTSDNYALGSIAVIDYVPRDGLTAIQARTLRTLSHQVIVQLELRRHLEAERRAADERLKRAVGETELQRDALIESSLDCAVAMDHEGRVTAFNPAAEATFGIARAAALGTNLATLVTLPPFGDPRPRALADRLAQRDGLVLNRPIETTARRADGKELPVELTVTRLGASEPPRFAGFIRDLSARKEAENAGRLATERFHLVARATNDAVWDWDLRTNALWWNENFQSLFGYPPEEIEAGIESWTRRIHPDDLARVKGHIYEVINQGDTAWSDEYRFRRRDGSYAEIFDRGYVLRDSRRAPLRMIGAMMDVTERRRAEEELRHSEERYRELVEGVREAIFTLGRDGAIESVNRAAEKLLGRSRDDLVGRPYLPLVQEDGRVVASEALERALRGEKLESFELRLLHGAGDAVSLELIVSPRLSGGRIVGVLAVARDVTERKRLEEQLRQSQKMEALGQLSGGIAHDFNNLLTVMHCNAVLISANPSDPGVKSCALEISQAAERAASLTRQLLVFSRKHVLQMTSVDVNEIATGMIRMLGRLLDERITVRTALAPDLPSIEADAGMLEQIFLNLVLNARDAMPEGGALTIETTRAILSDAQARAHPGATAGPCVCVRVRDTGAGIPADVLPRIFEPFFTTKEAGKGTGLGLATVYGIVEQHRGVVEVTSKVGEGTTFSIYLPVSDGRKSAPALRARRASSLPTGNETILVVEDETAVRLLLGNVLERCGYRVLQASTGTDALAIWEQHKDQIRLLITDLIMPGNLTGRALADRLRAENPRLAVVYCSGYTAELAGVGEPLVDGQNFLQKPYHPEQLARTVRERLDRA